ncbi:MAG TPA: DUF488 domain-containing protein [Burkholderiaceae bacterium]|nr:DUF488 domain-containing protein [Burkholderiaceae bacterium]
MAETAKRHTAPASGVETIWTVGHSTHPIDEFVAILASYGIETIVDIRSHPGSRKYPQFGKEALASSLREHGIAYCWLRALGGRRKAAADSPNTAWRNASFRGYADYMSTPEFKQGMDELLHLAGGSRTALMCAEAVWWRCHRSMVADALCVQGIQVLHIMDAGHAVEHPMTAPARIENGRLTYSPPRGSLPLL